MLGKDIRYMAYYRDEQEAVASSENESVATGYSDDDSDDDDYWKPKMDEMFKLFYEMMKNIQSLPGNNFMPVNNGLSLYCTPSLRKYKPLLLLLLNIEVIFCCLHF